MRVKVRNQIRLKHPITGTYRNKCKAVLKILEPDLEKYTNNIEYAYTPEYFGGILYMDNLDNKMFKADFTGKLYKVKEIVSGLWMVRVEEIENFKIKYKGVCYIKEHWFVGNVEPFHVE